VWLLTNRKAKVRRGKVQLIDASGERFWKSMRRSLGSKRREIPPEARDTIVHIFHEIANGNGEWSDVSKLFDTEDFGYRELRIERPLRLRFQATPDRIDARRKERSPKRMIFDRHSSLTDLTQRSA
jgi:type I restriction enzyme M protein